MRAASPVLRHSATQTSVASRNTATRNLCESVEARIDGVRKLIGGTAVHGFLGRVAAEMGWRPERSSRELSRVEKLSVALLVAAAELHRREGRGDDADALLAAVTGGAPKEIHTSGAIVIQMKDGQLLLNFAEETR